MNKYTYPFNCSSLFIGFSLFTICSTAFPSPNASLLPTNIIELKTFSYESYGQGNERVVLKSKKGNVNLDSQDINLIGDVEGKLTLDGKTFTLETEELSSNFLAQSISSKEKVLFVADGIEIVSSSIEIAQISEGGIKILFGNANFNKINSESRMNRGIANKIEFLPSKGLIFMKGKAEFYEDKMKIISDEIHYDLNEDRILKSINAKIINNL